MNRIPCGLWIARRAIAIQCTQLLARVLPGKNGKNQFFHQEVSQVTNAGEGMPIRRKVRIAPTKEIIGEPVLQIGVLGIGKGWSGYWFRPDSFQREPIMKDNVKIETTPAGEPPWAEGIKRLSSAEIGRGEGG